MTAAAAPAVPGVSLVVPITEEHDDPRELHGLFLAECQRLGLACEFLFVVHGEQPLLEGALAELEGREDTQIVRLAYTHDESVALNEGFRRARGRFVITLPAYHSVDPGALGPLLEAVEQGADCAVAVRVKRQDPFFNRLQARLYNRCVSLVAGRRLHDISNATRALRGDVARRVVLHGDQYRYLPVLLLSQGYRVVEVPVPQSPRERDLRLFGPRTYMRRLVDLAGIFFLVRFTKQPLRFFGVVGAVMSAAGLLLCVVLTYQRLVLQIGLADRPALLLGILLIVLGVQTASLGLLGEMVVHLQSVRDVEAEEMKEDAGVVLTSGNEPGSAPEPR